MEEDKSPNDAGDEDFDVVGTELDSTELINKPSSGTPRIWRKYLRKFFNIFFLGNIQRRRAESVNYPDIEEIFSKLGRVDDLEFCKAFYFFFGNNGMLVYEFISNVLNRFQRRLPHISEQQTLDYHGIVRGRILWKETFNRWFTRECMDFSTLTCQSPLKLFDTPENLLLRFILVQLNDMLELLNKLMSKFVVTGVTFDFSENQDEKCFLDRIQEMQRELIEALSNPYLRRLPLDPYLSPKILNKCEQSRNPDVRQFLVPLYNLLDELQTKQNLTILNDIVRNTLLEILPENPLFEVFVLFRVLEAIGGKNWAQKCKDIGLIRRGREHVAQFERLEGYDEIIVFYNLSFARIGAYIEQYYINTVQSAIFPVNLVKNAQELVKNLRNPRLVTKSFYKTYADLKIKSGRPDIAIIFRSGDEIFTKIVEVKNSKAENRGYIYRAIETTFIYAANYPSIFPEQPQKNCNPNIILAFNFGPTITREKIPKISGYECLALINYASVLDPFQGDVQILQELLEIPKR